MSICKINYIGISVFKIASFSVKGNFCSFQSTILNNSEVVIIIWNRTGITGPTAEDFYSGRQVLCPCTGNSKPPPKKKIRRPPLDHNHVKGNNIKILFLSVSLKVSPTPGLVDLLLLLGQLLPQPTE